MRIVRVLLAAATLAVPLFVTAPALADTIAVPHDYATIQEAVDAAKPGDTVRVAAGVYAEVVTVDKAITLAGAASAATIVDGGGKGHVIEIAADDVVVRDLAVSNGSTSWPYAGINLSSAAGCLIERCLATTTWAGIRFTASVKNTVRACTFRDSECGVDLGDTGSADNTLVDCQASNCKTAAYNAYAGSNGLHILRCAATDCGSGVVVAWSSGWMVECCTITSCDTGIVFDRATDGVVRHCTVTGGTNGMWVAGPGSSGNEICSSLFTMCKEAGIALQGAATGNSFHDNRLQECGLGVDIKFNASSPNQGNAFVRNAFVKNTIQATDDSGYANSFYGTYPWGNYWDDASGGDDYSGPDQDVPGPDGVFDDGYKLGSVFDKYPATTPDEKAPGTSLTAGPVGWVNTREAVFAWTGSDDRTPAGCLAYSYRLDDDPWTFDTVTGASFEGLSEGEHTFDVMARDGMGNDDPFAERATFGVDVTAPLTEDDGDTAWHQTDTTVHFTAWDEFSGVDSTEYSTDGGGSWTPGDEVTILAPSDGSGDGVFTVLYRSVDVAGNVEEVRSCIVKITTQSFAFDHLGASVGGTGDGVNAVITADLDGDGDPDVISGCGSAAVNEVTAWENDGTPFAGGWPQGAVGASTDSVHSLAAADLDGDGDIDVVSGSGDGEDYEIIGWENDGTPFNGGWVHHDLGAVTSGGTCHAEVALADFDRDGWVDLVSVASSYGYESPIAVWRNDHTPWNAAWTSVAVFESISSGSVAIGDFNRDPWKDIAVSCYEGNVLVWMNPGTPFSTAWTLTNAGYGGPGMVSSIATADFSGDGLDDFATSIGYLPSWSQKVWVDPSADYWPQVNYANIPATSVAAGDLDGDGLIDLFSGSHGSDPKLLAHVGAAPSPWAGFSTYEVADLDVAARDVALADFDGDGDLDAVSASDVSTGDEVLAWENLHTVDSVDPWSWSTYDGSWQTRSADLGLQADDAGSGVRAMEYRLGDHGPWSARPPAILRSNKRGWAGGVLTLQFRAIDNAGNVEPTNAVVVAIDRRPPVTVDDHDDGSWSSHDVTVHLTADDNVSGVRYVRYSVDGAGWQVGDQFTIAALEDHSNDGVHKVRYYAVDWAGNREVAKTCTVRIDTTAPLLVQASAAREVAPAAAGGPARGARRPVRALRVRFAVSDPGSVRVGALVTVRDARGRVLARVGLAGMRVGVPRTLSFGGSTAERAARVSITARDAAGFARTRALRL